MNICQRLTLVACCLSLGLLGIAVFSFSQLEQVKATARQTERVRVQQLGHAAAMELNITRISLQLRHAILARDQAERDTALSDIRSKQALVRQAVQSYEVLLFTEQGRLLFAKLPPALERLWSAADQNVQYIVQGEPAQAFAFLVDQTIPARNAVLAVLSDMVEYQRGHLTQDIDGIGRSADATLNAIVALALGCMLALFVASAYLGRVLRQRVQFTGQVVERIREGELGQVIHDGARDEFSPLVAALAQMQERLHQVVTDVRHNADAVELASNAMADDNAQLSSRTQGQVASLHATTEATEQLAATITANFDKAQSAVALANDAVQVAQRGGAVVGQVVSTMQEIHTSSKRIEEIIGVMNSIAFQTNILALNAAVEAARAGEQGRGFAVVATEVRTLAQRSAQAAQEIKQLIAASVGSVAEGAALVQHAGTTMQDIVVAIQQVKETVHHMDAASAAQNRSLVDVNGAMRTIEDATGHNAALVQKMHHASTELRGMAHGLVATVAYFRTERAQHALATAASVQASPLVKFPPAARPQALGRAYQQIAA